MIPIAKPWITEREKKEVLKVLDSGMLASGEWVEKFECRFAKYVGTDFAIATTSGTQALILALEAIGVKCKEVIVPSFTFISTVTSVIRAGGNPVFAEVDPETFTLDPSDVKRKITRRTKAIIPVHLYGHPADMDSILEIAEKRGLIVLEDAAQAHGAEWKDQKVGSIGHIAAFSFYATKNMTTGEGGMVTTNSKKYAEKIRLLINHGQKKRYLHVELGWNFRMTNIAAAIGLIQLKRLDKMNELRRRNAKFYDKHLRDLVQIPKVRAEARHVYHLYTIKVSPQLRKKLIEEFKREGIGFGIYYPRGVHQQPVMKKLGYTAKLPITEKLCKEVISIPVHPLVNRKDRQMIVDTIRDVVGKH